MARAGARDVKCRSIGRSYKVAPFHEYEAFWADKRAIRIRKVRARRWKGRRYLILYGCGGIWVLSMGTVGFRIWTSLLSKREVKARLST